MRFLPPCVLAAMILLLSVPTYAQTQMQMNQQAAGELAKADQQLNAVYASLVAKISPAGKDSLRAAQRTWLHFRDQECAFETSGSVDGSIHPMVVSQCKTRLTLARIKDLEQQVNCEEGDTACGGQ